MNKPFKLSIYALTAAFVLTGLAPLASAQPPEGAQTPRMHRMADRLDLSDEQKQLLREARQDTQENREELRDLHQQLSELIHSDHYNEAQAQMLTHAIAEKAQANMLRHANAQHAFYQSLNEEQKARMTQTRERTQERMNNRRSGPRGATPAQ